jgi:hypothetical protein
MDNSRKYVRGQKVVCNGNPQGVVQDQYSAGMYIVRLWQGLRHVGDVVVSVADLDLENPKPTAAP